jgi:hypothetical protein
MNTVGLIVNVYGYRNRTQQDEKSSALLWPGGLNQDHLLEQK